MKNDRSAQSFYSFIVDYLLSSTLLLTGIVFSHSRLRSALCQRRPMFTQQLLRVSPRISRTAVQLPYAFLSSLHYFQIFFCFVSTPFSPFRLQESFHWHWVVSFFFVCCLQISHAVWSEWTIQLSRIAPLSAWISTAAITAPAEVLRSAVRSTAERTAFSNSHQPRSIRAITPKLDTYPNQYRNAYSVSSTLNSFHRLFIIFFVNSSSLSFLTFLHN